MGNTMFIFIALGFIAFFFFIYWSVLQQLKEKLSQLVSVISGVVSTKFRLGTVYAILEGSWMGERVKVELKKVMNPRHPIDLFATVYGPHRWPFSLKIKPLSKNIFDVMGTSMKFFGNKYKLKMTDEKIEVVSNVNDENRIKNFLNADRLKIIHYIFENGFNLLEIDKDKNTNSYVKVGVEPSYWWKPEEEIKARVLEPTMIVEILQNLKNFIE
ncbi:MAG: hypothetical protein CVV37_08050 [Nitrospira bacterium HGW-Nitrospira-1]|nr:MAG: hypothetical protein CVV37_08050 [Nitrospira bacterium HGW-Nitrospira-1]